MKTLVVLLVVLTICLPIYGENVGEILVYKVTMNCSIGAVFREPNSLDSGWQSASCTINAWMIYDVNLSTNYLNDAKMITYGKDPNGAKVYVNNIDLQKSDGWTYLPGVQKSARTYQPDMYVCAWWTESGVITSNPGVEVDYMQMQGQAKAIDIGLTNKLNVPVKLTGVAMLGYKDTESFVGSGSASATLDTTWTKQANNPGQLDGSFSNTVIAIETFLENNGKGYKGVSQ